MMWEDQTQSDQVDLEPTLSLKEHMTFDPKHKEQVDVLPEKFLVANMVVRIAPWGREGIL